MLEGWMDPVPTGSWQQFGREFGQPIDLAKSSVRPTAAIGQLRVARAPGAQHDAFVCGARQQLAPVGARGQDQVGRGADPDHATLRQAHDLGGVRAAAAGQAPTGRSRCAMRTASRNTSTTRRRGKRSEPAALDRVERGGSSARRQSVPFGRGPERCRDVEERAEQGEGIVPGGKEATATPEGGSLIIEGVARPGRGRRSGERRQRSARARASGGRCRCRGRRR